MRDEWELSELVKMTELPKTTVHRIILNLQNMGYVDQVRGSHRYTHTTKIFELFANHEFKPQTQNSISGMKELYKYLK